jgi:hypothetical protein
MHSLFNDRQNGRGEVGLFYKRKIIGDLVMPDYLIVDSQHMEERIPISKLLQNPREILGMLLLASGTYASICNVVGSYRNTYFILQMLVISSGALLAIVDLVSALPPYTKPPTESVSPNIRMGVVDDALLNIYSGIYTGCVSWHTLRTTLLCPVGWTQLDAFIGPIALLIFLFSILCPVLTLIHHSTGAFPGL